MKTIKKLQKSLDLIEKIEGKEFISQFEYVIKDDTERI